MASQEGDHALYYLMLWIDQPVFHYTLLEQIVKKVLKMALQNDEIEHHSFTKVKSFQTSE